MEQRRLAAAGYIRRDPLDPSMDEAEIHVDGRSYYAAWRRDRHSRTEMTASLFAAASRDRDSERKKTR